MAYNITGFVRSIKNEKGLEGLTVELFNNSGSPIGLPTVTTSPNGYFQFIGDDGSVTGILRFKVTEGATVLLNSEDSPAWTEGFAGNVNLLVNKDPKRIVKITGSITDIQGTPVEGITIGVNKIEFRSNTLMTTTTSDVNGKFVTEIDSSDVESDITGLDIGFEAYFDMGIVLATTSVFLSEENTYNVNLIINESFTNASHFENILASIETITSSEDLSTLTDDEITFVATNTGRNATDIQNIVAAYKYASDIEVTSSAGKAMMYALMQSNDTTTAISPIIGLREVDITTLITDAIENKKIPDYSGDLPAFINAVKEGQVEAMKTAELPNEAFTLNDVLLPMFPDQSSVDEFLHSFNDSRNNTEGSEDFFGGLDPEIIKGIRLASITGSQPEIIAALLDEVDGDVGLHQLATKTTTFWEELVETVCTTVDRICLPVSIKGNYDLDDPEQVEQAKIEYARVLKTVAQETYPLAYIRFELEGSNGANLIADSGDRSQVITFLENNPDYDTRRVSVEDINEVDYDLTGIADVNVIRSELLPFQRLFNVTGGKPEAIAMLKSDGLVSASGIAELSEEQFIADYSETFGGDEIASIAFAKAASISLATGNAVMYMTDILANPDVAVMNGATDRDAVLAALGSSNPDLATLFGSTDYCACQECLSLYSPAAYLTDLLSFLKNKAFTSYQELIRRRPDLKYIDLTCKNTNTPVPYIDLTNELLEKYILEHNSQTTPSSYQTRGTAAELAAHPEHVKATIVSSVKQYTDDTSYTYAYDSVLSQQIYPDVLPFNLALEETRTYLQHMGMSRLSLMKLFKPLDTSTTYDINSFSIACEVLGVSLNAGKIISGTHASSSSTWLFYGLKVSTSSSANPENGFPDPLDSGNLLYGLWTDLLCDRLDGLIRQLNISYRELLELLTTRFLNPENKISITINSSGVSESTCELHLLKLTFSAGATASDFLGRLYRFVRLSRATKFPNYKLDVILNQLNITTLNEGDLYLFTRVLELSQKLNIKLEELTMWWANADTKQYINYNSDNQNTLPSIYDTVFRNKTILNAPITFFDDPNSLPSSYTDKVAYIASFTRMKEDDAALILDFLGISDTSYSSTAITLPILSRVYIFGSVARSLNYSVAHFLALIKTLDLNSSNVLASNHNVNSDPTVLESLETLADVRDLIDNSDFSFDELQYLVRDIGVKENFGINDANIQSFYEELRSELQKIPLDNATTYSDETKKKLKNCVIQQFAKQFKVSASIIKILIEDIQIAKVSAGTIDTIDALIDPVFIDAKFFVTTSVVEKPALSKKNLAELEASRPNATLPDFDMLSLYSHYYLLNKILLLTGRLKLTDNEFEYLYLNNTVIDFDMSSLPFDGENSSVTKPLFNSVLRLSHWIKIKNSIRLSDDYFIDLLSSAFGGSTSTLKADWISVILQNTNWSTQLTDLIGLNTSTSTAGILMTNFNADFIPSSIDSIKLLNRLRDIIGCCRTIELSPQTVYNVLIPSLVLADSNKIRLAAKGKHNNESWLKIAKPLQDVLRAKKRDALVAYVVNNPEPYTTTNKKVWSSVNELYANLLIDTEMQPCTMTSRIKLAISSIQLFIDRVLLGIEYSNYDVTQRLSFAKYAIEQWEKWRKWYRIWEANRKVFLYPENWIEPELRGGKSVFFEELEADLAKDNFSDSLAEDALRSYLNKLDEVARLEPVGMFRQYLDEEDELPPPNNGYGILFSSSYQRPYMLHAISRTYGEPHRYYYRKYGNNEWTPWERIDIDINSDHVMPYVYNRRLYLYWLTFQRKRQGERPNTTNAPNLFFFNKQQNSGSTVFNSDTATGQEQLVITLNWSEYKDGKWLKQKVGHDKMTLKINPDAEDNNWNYSHFSRQPDVYRKLSKNNEIWVPDMIKSQLHISGAVHKPSNSLYISITSPYSTFNSSADRLTYTHAFRFADNFSDPEVVRNDHLKINFLTPKNTFPQNMKFVKASNTDPILYVNGVYTIPTNQYVYIHNDLRYMDTYCWNVSGYILRKAPFGDYRVTSISNFVNDAFYTGTYVATFGSMYNWRDNNPVFSDFIYEDQKNTFLATNSKAAGIFNDDPSYIFTTFYHPYVKLFLKRLNSEGMASFFDITTQNQGDSINFAGNYDPTSRVATPRPTGIVDFSYSGSYSLYNWELFFHLPLMVAQRLYDNQKFAEARKWFHYVFDPTCNTDQYGGYTNSKQRFWRFKPFYDEAGGSIQTLNDLLTEINNGVSGAVNQVNTWENDPFDPHAIARLRKVAYMKNVVMKYIDNLIAWGDKLFNQDTIESINEATQLYILAANILGKRPEEIPNRVQVAPKSFSEIEGSLDAFSNAKVAFEKYIGPNAPIVNYYYQWQYVKQWWGGYIWKLVKVVVPPNPVFYFCLTKNDKLLGYWNTVADRLFKIRNCMNISGQVRQLPLFEPPIDPALLVKAAANGIDTQSLFDSLNGPVAQYRFTYILQKANEFCNDVKALGSELLSALEKKDAEYIALLRSTHEIKFLEKVKEIKERQIQDAEANIEALVKNKEVIQTKLDYYNSRPFMNAKETEAMKQQQIATVLQVVSGEIASLGASLGAIPQIHVQVPMATGPSFGGQHLAAVMQAISTKIGVHATIANAKSSMASTVGGYVRRQDDWRFQAQSAKKELEQMDKQMVSLEIKKSIAERELDNHQQQIENTIAVDEYMHDKFTNEQLYNWMVSQISTTYFQAYQLAYDMAKTAEACFNYELPFAKKAKSGYIKFGYWDSLKKGLLAGGKLQHDIRKLEGAYIDGNKRDVELTKHVSLAMLDPLSLIDLRNLGTCNVTIPEWIYDLDYPGHYHRRIKSVSLSIPCVSGPYTTIACTLAMTSHQTYNKDGTAATVVGDPVCTQIATSSAQNDAGMFEFNFKDERYLPFEGCGADTQWTISVMNDPSLRQFDFDTISDIILHIKYTAEVDGNGFSGSPGSKAEVTKTKLGKILDGTYDDDPGNDPPPPIILLPRYFSLRHEFSNELNVGFTALADIGFDSTTSNVGRPFSLTLKHDQFPYYCKGRTIKVKNIHFYIKSNIAPDKFVIHVSAIDSLSAADINLNSDDYVGMYSLSGTDRIEINSGGTKNIPLKLFKVTGSTPGTPGIVNESDIDNVFMVCEYHLD